MRLEKTHRKLERGFTLIETLLGIVVMGIVMLAFASIARLSVDSYSLIVDRKEAMSQARYALNRITQELVSINPASITSISSTNLSFNDSVGNPTNFRSQTTSGVVQIFRGNDLLATNVSSFGFVYYDANNNLISDGNLSNLRRIAVDMGVYAGNGNGHGDMKMRGEVYPRNYYYSNFQ